MAQHDQQYLHLVGGAFDFERLARRPEQKILRKEKQPLDPLSEQKHENVRTGTRRNAGRALG